MDEVTRNRALRRFGNSEGRWVGKCGREVAALVVAAVLSAGLAACGDATPADDGVQTTAAESAGETSEGGAAAQDGEETDDAPGPAAGPPELSVPVAPPEMAVEDETGAVATVAFYWQLVTYARATGDTELLSGLASPECGYCAQEVAQIEGLHAEDRWAVQDSYLMEVAAVAPPSADYPAYVVHFALTAPQAVVYSADGTSVAQEAATYPNFGFVLQWIGDGFAITGASSDTSG